MSISFCESLGDPFHGVKLQTYFIHERVKAKDSDIVPYPLCLGNISKDFTTPYRLETGLFWYVYDFSVDYWAIANDKILDIHKYLMEKNNLKWCLNLLKSVFSHQ